MDRVPRHLGFTCMERLKDHKALNMVDPANFPMGRRFYEALQMFRIHRSCASRIAEFDVPRPRKRLIVLGIMLQTSVPFGHAMASTSEKRKASSALPSPSHQALGAKLQSIVVICLSCWSPKLFLHVFLACTRSFVSGLTTVCATSIARLQSNVATHPSFAPIIVRSWNS